MPRGVTPKGEIRNDIQFTNYRKLWGLIKKHMATGAYVEVITALETIIYSRLWTYFSDFTETDPSLLRGREASFGGFIKLWKKHEKIPIRDKRYQDLQSAVWEWRDQRNKGTHSRGLKRGQLMTFDEVTARNKSTAEEGILLAKSVGNWLDRLKYKLEKTEGKSIPNRRHI